MPPIPLDSLTPLPLLPIPMANPLGTLLNAISGGLPDGSIINLSTRFKKVGGEMGTGRTNAEIAGRLRTSLGVPGVRGDAGLQAWGVVDTDGGSQCHVSLLLHPTLRC